MAKKRGRVFLWFERASLGIGMTVVAFVIERRLLKAIKQGGLKARPPEEQAEAPKVELTTSANQVRDQADGEDASR